MRNALHPSIYPSHATDKGILTKVLWMYNVHVRVNLLTPHLNEIVFAKLGIG